MASINRKRREEKRRRRRRKKSEEGWLEGVDSAPVALAEVRLSHAAHCHLLVMLHRDRERKRTEVEGERKRERCCSGVCVRRRESE
jgi:hypothetical protein